MEQNPKYKSGYISIIGKPNVGKSSIINSLLERKLNIVTSRSQTTRNNILGILTTKAYQMIFIDTPGIHKPRTLLGKHMIKQSRSSLSNADVIAFCISATRTTEEDNLVLNLIKKVDKPVFLVINKIDLIEKQNLLPLINDIKTIRNFCEIVPISATRHKNLDTLKKKFIDYLPEGPQYYPEGQISDKQERFFIAEIIRENALKTLREEIPHSVAVLIEGMKDRSNSLRYIGATIYVERDSQKKIIIGTGGSNLKNIGSYSRTKLEAFIGKKIYLELWVKVYKNWRKDPRAVEMLGYG